MNRDKIPSPVYSDDFEKDQRRREKKRMKSYADQSSSSGAAKSERKDIAADALERQTTREKVDRWEKFSDYRTREIDSPVEPPPPMTGDIHPLFKSQAFWVSPCALGRLKSVLIQTSVAR